MINENVRLIYQVCFGPPQVLLPFPCWSFYLPPAMTPLEVGAQALRRPCPLPLKTHPQGWASRSCLWYEPDLQPFVSEPESDFWPAEPLTDHPGGIWKFKSTRQPLLWFEGLKTKSPWESPIPPCRQRSRESERAENEKRMYRERAGESPNFFLNFYETS